MNYSLLQHPVILSIAVITIAFLARLIIKWFVKKKAQHIETDKRVISQTAKHFIHFAAVVLLLVIWSSEIQNFALSVAAFAVAIVLATREFIACIIGFVYLITTRPFKTGDWIHVGDYHGEVFEIDWIKTTIHEVDMHSYQFTRKTVFIPNNKLITSSIKNLNFMKRFATHNFFIVRKESIDPFPIYDALLKNAKKYCKDFREVAARYNSIIERKLDAKVAGPEPEIHFGTTEIGDFKVSISLFCPTETAVHIEHLLTKDFMKFWYQQIKVQPISKPI